MRYVPNLVSLDGIEVEELPVEDIVLASTGYDDIVTFDSTSCLEAAESDAHLLLDGTTLTSSYYRREIPAVG